MEERLRRSEYEAVRCLLGAVSYAAHARDDLKDRLETIGRGNERMNEILNKLDDITSELLGQVPDGQCRQLRNTMKDMEMRMIPKLTPMSQNVLMEKDNAKALIDRAMERCHGCVEDEKSCLECGLYKVLESMLPLDSYDNGMLCPYALSEWKD